MTQTHLFVTHSSAGGVQRAWNLRWKLNTDEVCILDCQTSVDLSENICDYPSSRRARGGKELQPCSCRVPPQILKPSRRIFALFCVFRGFQRGILLRLGSVLAHAPFTPKKHVSLKNRRSAERGLRGVFLGCFSLFWARKNSGNTPPWQLFTKQKGWKSEKKTGKIFKKSKSPKKKIAASGVQGALAWLWGSILCGKIAKHLFSHNLLWGKRLRVSEFWRNDKFQDKMTQINLRKTHALLRLATIVSPLQSTHGWDMIA